MSGSTGDVLRRAADLQAAGRGAVVCLLARTSGSTPQQAGALMVIDDAAMAFGTIGGGCVEAEVRGRAFEMLSRGERGRLVFTLDHDYGWDDGMLCGGTVELVVAPPPAERELRRVIADLDARRRTSLVLEIDDLDDPDDPDNQAVRARYRLLLPPRDRLYIAGAGHLGQAVAAHGLRLDFDVTMFDDRADLLERFAPAGAATVPGDIATRLAEAPVDERTFGVIVTRGHRHDAQALAALVGRGAGYLGMIGSRRKVDVVFKELIERGVPETALRDVRAPIGLDIGAVAVEEIALSIAAQLVEARRARRARGRSAVVRLPDRPLAGVVLAAGRGRRMGGAKQITPLPGGVTLVAAAYDAIADVCDDLVVVVGHRSEEVTEALGSRPFRPIAADPDAEMYESIRVALADIQVSNPGADVLLQPGDHPRVKPKTLDLIVAAIAAHRGAAIIPTHDGCGGHPIVIPAAQIDALVEHAGEGGLGAYWRAHPERCHRLAVDDESVLRDVDEPADVALTRP